MDHGGQFEREGRVMSQVQVGEVDHCDNLSSPETLTAQTQNLNETNMLTKTESLSLLQKEDGGGCDLIQKASPSDNGKDTVEKQEKEGYMEGGREDDEEDIDEVMKEEEEEEEEISEASSSLLRCQSPDTPMTDSSYSETGSLLETPYPFSPATSPEPTSPVIPVVGPEVAYPISEVALSQSDVKVGTRASSNESVASNTGSITLGPTFTTGLVDSATLTMISDLRHTSPPVPTCIRETTERIAKNANLTAEHFTSSTEPIFNHGLTCTRGFSSLYAPPITSTAETFTVTACATRLNTSIASTPMSATTGPLTFTAGPMTTGTDSTSTTGPITSDWKQITSTPLPTCFSVSTCTTGPIPSPALLESLEQLAQRGDDTHLPQYLHQIAEAFVLHEDYQRALWCIKLERLYHQRLLENLNALQEQWERQCRTTSPDLATQHLDTLKHICQTHNRPRAEDAVWASLDVLRPTIEEGGALPPCASARQVDGERAEDSCHFQSSHPVIPSINLVDRLSSPEISEKDREDPDRELKERDGLNGSQLTDRQGSDREEGEKEGGEGHAISVIRNELHPSTAGEMDQPKPAEQQGGDFGLAQEREANREEGETDKEETAEALEMEDEGEDEEEERLKEGHSSFCQKALPVETLVSGAEVETQQLQQEALAEEQLHEETQMSPASGLVSILKKRSVCVENVSVSGSSEPRHENLPAKRRVRFKVPDDGYEQDVGGGDSCLLLFLLCLVTVVISVGGTALYCALGDSHSSVCQDFSRNADFYIGQIQRGISHIQHWFTPGS
uniref:consortin isoform X2 n=1 Tax=Scatophagus argus TaxID=75038 RepID=UPI001ED85E9E|nr:consortin isoform X2 [Scatophagus argus]